VEFNNDKYKVLYLGQNQTLATAKDLNVLVDKLNMNQICSLMTNHMLGYVSHTVASRLREVIILI